MFWQSVRFTGLQYARAYSPTPQGKQTEVPEIDEVRRRVNIISIYRPVSFDSFQMGH